MAVRRLVPAKRPAPQAGKTEGTVYVGLLAYSKLLVLFITLIGGDFLLEFRIEYLYPVYLLLHNVYEAWRYQGVATTLLLLSLVLSVDLICLGALPPSALTILGSVAVWAQISFGFSPAGPLLVLPLLFYLEPRLQAPSRLPLASHCLGFPLVSIAFAFKEYLTTKWRRRTRKTVEGKNGQLYGLLEEAVGLEPPLLLEEEEPPQVQQQVQQKKRRKSIEEQPQNNNNCCKPAVKEEDHHLKLRKKRDDCCYKLELELRRLKQELGAARSSEQELRGQLQSSAHAERVLRAEVGALQAEVEGLEGMARAEAQRATEEKLGLERRLAEERRAKEVALGRLKRARAVEQQPTPTPIPTPTNPDTLPAVLEARRRATTLQAQNEQLKSDLSTQHEKMARLERELSNVKSTLLHEQKSSESSGESLRAMVKQLEEERARLESSLNAETKLKLDLFGALGEARREVAVRDGVVKKQEEELEELRGQLQFILVARGGGGGYSS